MVLKRNLFYALVLLSGLCINTAKAFEPYAENESTPELNKAEETLSPEQLQKNKNLEDVYKGNIPVVATEPSTISGSFNETVGLFEIGKPDMRPAIVKKSGRNKVIQEALKVIIPNDWYAKMTPDVNPALRIHWKKGKRWVKLLKDVALEYRLSILVDWNTKTVTLVKQHIDQISPLASMTGSENFNLESDRLVPAVDIAATPLPATVLPPVLAISSAPKSDPPIYTSTRAVYINGPLKQAATLVVKRWGKEMDWAIDESLGVYALSYNVLIPGKTLEDDLQTLSDAVSNEILRIKFDIYANNVVKLSKSGDE